MQRAPEITYYEELGVTRTASHEQIRDAFRALVRLLHPDQQTDEHLRNIAEVQMRKLNRIYAVLSDAEKRRNYDDTLDQSPSARTIILRQNAGPTVQRLLARFAWIGAVLIVVALLAWLSSEGPGSTVQSFDRPGPLRPPAITASADTQSEVAQLRRDLNQARAERDAAVRELAHLRTSPGRKPESDPQDAEVTMPTPAPPTPVSSEIPVPTHAGTFVHSGACPTLNRRAAEDLRRFLVLHPPRAGPAQQEHVPLSAGIY